MDMGNLVPRRRQRLDTKVYEDTATQDENQNVKGKQSVAAEKVLKEAPANACVLRDGMNLARSPKLPARGPTAKEIAAAKAARVRLGYEEADNSSDASVVAAPKLPDGPEPAAPQHVDFVPLQEAKPCQNAANSLKEVSCGLRSTNWVAVCQSLAVLQQLTAHHQEELSSQLEDIAPLMVKHIQSLRSQLSKVAILCYCDLIRIFEDEMLSYIDGTGPDPKPSDSALCQLLMKAVSKDKKFVLEAAQGALQMIADTLSSNVMARNLMPYLKHKNPNVRGAASGVLATVTQHLCKSISRSEMEEMCRNGLLSAVSSLLNDRTPDARSSSRRIILMIREVVIQGSPDVPDLASEPSSDQENAGCANISNPSSTTPGSHGAEATKRRHVDGDAWEALCSSVLSATEFSAVGRVAKEDD